MKVLNLLFHLVNAVMNLIEICVDVVETFIHVKGHSLEGFLQRSKSTQILW